MAEDERLVTEHEWVRWLTGVDAQLLLMVLCHDIEHAETQLDTLRQMVQGWRANALQALNEDDWTAPVDDYLEIRADARLYLMSQGKL